jgi:hypothetical protein
MDMLHNFVFPQTAAEVDSLFFQQDGVPDQAMSTHFLK